MSVAMGIRGRARRREIGLTTVELARRLGYSRGRLYNLECYGAGSLRVIERWAKALDDADPAWLAFGRPEVETARGRR